jgi:hypothetical protein
VIVFRLTSADFCSPLMRLWVEPAGRERKSADIERKMVMLIYPYALLSPKIFSKAATYPLLYLGRVWSFHKNFFLSSGAD